MLDILFSLQFVWITLVVTALSTGVAFICAYLHKHLLQTTAGIWLTEHVYCPVLKTLVLVCMTLLLFPLMVESSNYSQVLTLFVDNEYLTNMVNILFVSSLLLTLIPLLNHPAIAMPLLGCIATALLFLSYFDPQPDDDFSLFPDLQTSIKIFLLLIVIYWVSRWIIDLLATYIDHRFIVSGSKTLVSDIIYLIFQIPVMLAYAHGLNQQLIPELGHH